jgi:hypothetical protein
LKATTTTTLPRSAFQSTAWPARSVRARSGKRRPRLDENLARDVFEVRNHGRTGIGARGIARLHADERLVVAQLEQPVGRVDGGARGGVAAG